MWRGTATAAAHAPRRRGVGGWVWGGEGGRARARAFPTHVAVAICAAPPTTDRPLRPRLTSRRTPKPVPVPQADDGFQQVGKRRQQPQAKANSSTEPHGAPATVQEPPTPSQQQPHQRHGSAGKQQGAEPKARSLSKTKAADGASLARQLEAAASKVSTPTAAAALWCDWLTQLGGGEQYATPSGPRAFAQVLASCAAVDLALAATVASGATPAASADVGAVLRAICSSPEAADALTAVAMDLAELLRFGDAAQRPAALAALKACAARARASVVAKQNGESSNGAGLEQRVAEKTAALEALEARGINSIQMTSEQGKVAGEVFALRAKQLEALTGGAGAGGGGSASAESLQTAVRKATKLPSGPTASQRAADAVEAARKRVADAEAALAVAKAELAHAQVGAERAGEDPPADYAERCAAVMGHCKSLSSALGQGRSSDAGGAPRASKGEIEAAAEAALDSLHAFVSLRSREVGSAATQVETATVRVANIRRDMEEMARVGVEDGGALSKAASKLEDILASEEAAAEAAAAGASEAMVTFDSMGGGRASKRPGFSQRVSQVRATVDGMQSAITRMRGVLAGNVAPAAPAAPATAAKSTRDLTKSEPEAQGEGDRVKELEAKLASMEVELSKAKGSKQPAEGSSKDDRRAKGGKDGAKATSNGNDKGGRGGSAGGKAKVAEPAQEATGDSKGPKVAGAPPGPALEQEAPAPAPAPRGWGVVPTAPTDAVEDSSLPSLAESVAASKVKRGGRAAAP